MKPSALFLALFVASVQAGLPSPSLSLPSEIPSLTASASTPTSSIQIPKCVLNCAASSIASSDSLCTSIQDPCTCTDTKFQDAMNGCLKDCTAAEQLAAKALEKGICAAIPTSNSASNGALTVQFELVQTSVFALTVAVAGAVMGGFI